MLFHFYVYPFPLLLSLLICNLSFDTSWEGKILSCDYRNFTFDENFKYIHIWVVYMLQRMSIKLNILFYTIFRYVQIKWLSILILIGKKTKSKMKRHGLYNFAKRRIWIQDILPLTYNFKCHYMSLNTWKKINATMIFNKNFVSCYDTI